MVSFVRDVEKVLRILGKRVYVVSRTTGSFVANPETFDELEVLGGRFESADHQVLEKAAKVIHFDEELAIVVLVGPEADAFCRGLVDGALPDRIP